MKPLNEDEEIRVLGGSQWHAAGENEVAVSRGEQLQQKQPQKRNHFVKKLLVALLILGALVSCAFYCYLEFYVYRFNYPLSRTQEEVIASFTRPHSTSVVGISATQDSILGVSMKLFKIDGLKAELVVGVPDLEDENLYLVTRSSDYRYQHDEPVIIGDYILSGEELQHNGWRAGYFSIVDGNAEIGVGRRPEMRAHILENQGSMFRQFALVSAGIKCLSQYRLKGKVPRSAYARMPNNDLYFVETKYPETLFGFSDALIEYGFVDAIYITGGAQTDLFYRDANGVRHGEYVDDKPHRMVVWKKTL